MSDLIEYLENLTINYDLGKYLKVLTTIIDFAKNVNLVPRAINKTSFFSSSYSKKMSWGKGWENIWKFGVAMKQSENSI